MQSDPSQIPASAHSYRVMANPAFLKLPFKGFLKLPFKSLKLLFKFLKLPFKLSISVRTC